MHRRHTLLSHIDQNFRASALVCVFSAMLQHLRRQLDTKLVIVPAPLELVPRRCGSGVVVIRTCIIWLPWCRRDTLACCRSTLTHGLLDWHYYRPPFSGVGPLFLVTDWLQICHWSGSEPPRATSRHWEGTPVADHDDISKITCHLERGPKPVVIPCFWYLLTTRQIQVADANIIEPQLEWHGTSGGWWHQQPPPSCRFAGGSFMTST